MSRPSEGVHRCSDGQRHRMNRVCVVDAPRGVMGRPCCGTCGAGASASCDGDAGAASAHEFRRSMSLSPGTSPSRFRRGYTTPCMRLTIALIASPERRSQRPFPSLTERLCSSMSGRSMPARSIRPSTFAASSPMKRVSCSCASTARRPTTSGFGGQVNRPRPASLLPSPGSRAASTAWNLLSAPRADCQMPVMSGRRPRSLRTSARCSVRPCG